MVGVLPVRWLPYLPLSDSPPLVLLLKGTPRDHLQLPDEQALSGIIIHVLYV